MFGLFKSEPTKKLRKHYNIKLKHALDAQRKGDIRAYALLTAEAQEIWSQIVAIEQHRQQ